MHAAGGHLPVPRLRLPKTTIAKVTPPLLPFFLAMIVGRLLITDVPDLSIWIPEVFAG